MIVVFVGMRECFGQEILYHFGQKIQYFFDRNFGIFGKWVNLKFPMTARRRMSSMSCFKSQYIKRSSGEEYNEGFNALSAHFDPMIFSQRVGLLCTWRVSTFQEGLSMNVAIVAKG